MNTSGSKYVSAIFVNGKDGFELLKWSSALAVGSIKDVDDIS